MSSGGTLLKIGGRVREYEIQELIGSGGMGAVYRARHVYLDEERAIKVVRPGLMEGVNPVDRFIREARILVKLRHPNLVQLHEFGTLEDGTFFMVMELVRGESVLQRLGWMQRIPIDASINIIREAALGLGAAHAQGIVHRDISPDNLLLVKAESNREITKVIDFGIAKPVAEDAPQHTLTTGLYIGKPQYSSPEQCGLLDPGETIDHRSDVYSLAITFYQMITGKLPFIASSPQAYILKHASETPAPPSTHFPRGELPRELDALILRALAKRRDQRPSSMEEFLRELEEVSYSRRSDATAILPRTLPTPHAPRPGGVFAGRFQIERELGHGGMGTVFKAIDRILGVPVAIKVMSDVIAGNPMSLERLKREVILARRVAHPNACRIFDIGEYRGTHYVTMEYVEGRTLSAFLKAEGKLSLQIGTQIARQVLRALQEAHRVGVIHRDLKPQNIMVDDNNRAYIMDFGLSIATGAERLTQAGSFVGTPAYMAPEQHQDKTIDLRADLYAMGIIMFELFTGRRPFSGSSPVQVIMAHINEAPPKPSSIFPDFSPELERVIMKLLEKDPKDRFQSAGEALQALESLGLSGGETTELNRESVVHRMMVEKRYSQAVKLLSAMIGTDPGNPRWKKLLQTAVAEKVLRDLRRVRKLLRDGRLSQAGPIIEQLSNMQIQSTKVRAAIGKTRDEYAAEVEVVVQKRLDEAEAALTQGDRDSAERNLKEVERLQPGNERAGRVRERVEEARRAQRARYIEVVARAQAMRDELKWEEAIETLREAAGMMPAEPEAPELLQRIDGLMQAEIRDRAQVAVQLTDCRRLLDAGNLEGARRVIDHVESMLAGVARLQDLKKKAHELAETHRQMKAADEKRRLDEEQQRAEELRQRQEAETERLQRLGRYERAMEEGKRRLDAREWLPAAESFRNALDIFPDKEEPARLLRQAEQQASRVRALTDELRSLERRVAEAEAKSGWEDVIRLCEIALASKFDEVRTKDSASALAAKRAQATARIEEANRERAAKARAMMAAPPPPEPVPELPPAPQVEETTAPAAMRVRRSGLPRFVLPAAALVILALLGIWLISSRGPAEQVATQPAPTPAETEAVEAPPVTPSTEPSPAATPALPVSIDAVPWARVSLQPLAENHPPYSIPVEELVTPCSFSLPAGTYTLTLENGGISAPLTTTITVRPEAENAFLIKLPGYDPRRAALEWSGQ